VKFITIRRNFTEGECHPFGLWGDWHTGNKACAKSELLADREDIRTRPNALYANMGDNADYITADGDRRFRAADLDPDILSLADLDRLGDIETAWITEFEAPVIDRCVVQLGSNHPGRFDRKHSTDTMCRKLEALGGAELRDKLWAPAMAVVRLVYTDESRHACEVVLNLHHGTHIAKYPSTLLNQLLIKARYWPTVDVIARGHCHFCRSDHQERQVFDRNYTRSVEQRIIVVLTGGYLKSLAGGYSEDMDLDPIDIGMAWLNIFPSRNGARIEAVT
jgi:hypothetical protein